jgi:tRNA modification GTPase
MTIAEQPVGRILFGYWEGEDVVVIRMEENEWELHCHGGYAAVNRVQNSLESRNVQIQDWREFQNDLVSTLAREFQIAISESVTWKTAELLLRHPTTTWIHQLRCWVKALAESPSTGLASEIQTQCEHIVDKSQIGIRLTKAARVVLAGAPNVGKSSLLNRLAGYERSIVQNRPGTTRDTFGAEIALGGYPVTLTDTAGIRETDDSLESAGISRARQVLSTADLILFLIDGTAAPTLEENQFLEQYPDAVPVLHKSDQAVHPERTMTSGLLRVSALTGEGTKTLIDEIVRLIVPASPDSSTIFPITRRQRNCLHEIVSATKEQNFERLNQSIKDLLTDPLSID